MTAESGLHDFWYIAAESKHLGSSRPLKSEVWGRTLVLFRDLENSVVCLDDRCLHKCAPLSRGHLHNGQLKCSYHGWTYDSTGSVVHIPADGPTPQKTGRRARRYTTLEKDGYVYVRFNEKPLITVDPFSIPELNAPGFAHVRLINYFENDITNCAENFVNVPHTAYVHPRIFRNEKWEKLSASVARKGSSVHIEYHGERANLGFFSFFLNPGKEEIGHSDFFHMPNTTSVEYRFQRGKRFIITSQCVPGRQGQTIVYTDLTYNYGIWNWIAKPIIKKHAQKIIDQDVEILGLQQDNVKKFGPHYSLHETDVVHVYIDSIIRELEQGRDPRLLPEKSHEIDFWV